jgi:hypothetical protein
MKLACEAPPQRRPSDPDKAAMPAGSGLRVMRDVKLDAAGIGGTQLVTVDADHEFALPNADADCVFCQSVMVVAAAVGKHSLVASVTYTNERNMIKTASATFVFLCHSPFTVGASVASTNSVQMVSSATQPQAASVMLKTAVMLGITLTVASPDAIVVNSACLAPNPFILTIPHSNSSTASDSISPLHSVDDQVACKGADVVLPFLVAFRSFSSASCGTLRLVWQRAHAPVMQFFAASGNVLPAPTLSLPPNTSHLADGSVISSSKWLETYSPKCMTVMPVNFRAPMPCPACYSSNFSIDLLLPSKVIPTFAPQYNLTAFLKHGHQVVVGVPADIAFVVSSCSDLLEDVEVEVEQASSNFIIAGYFKVPTLSPSFALLPVCLLIPYRYRQP